MEKGSEAREAIAKQIATLIDEYPSSVADALRVSKAFFEYPYTKKDLADASAYSIVNNRLFQKNISVLIGFYKAGLLDKGERVSEEQYVTFSNIAGKGTKIDSGKLGKDMAQSIATSTGAWAQTGGWIGAIVGAVIGAVDAGFQWGTASKKAKTNEEIAKAQIYAELFDKDKKRKKNYWIPIAVLGGVLLVGGVVTFIVLKEK